MRAVSRGRWKRRGDVTPSTAALAPPAPAPSVRRVGLNPPAGFGCHAPPTPLLCFGHHHHRQHRLRHPHAHDPAISPTTPSSSPSRAGPTPPPNPR
ncbi:hypothetical protein S40288_10488 [Stachybotrys chartarum IBT 40288]|nr:hypothetical protein S40288_10488 [Stachybotrys chartarum IBT 40288]